MEKLSFILNNVFYFSILLIILSSIIGVFIRMRSRDRCLKDFHGFHVTLKLTDGSRIWGLMHVYGSGIELIYSDLHADSDGHFEESYILYSAEFNKIFGIYRFHDQLTEENKHIRKKEIIRTYRAPFFRRFRRRFRNFFNTFRDAATQTFTLVIGNLAASRPKSAISKKQKDLAGLGSEVIGTLSKAYDPILEKNIGHFVVLESIASGEKSENCGILKEYTDRFIEILNVIYRDVYEKSVIYDSGATGTNVVFHWNHKGFTVSNSSGHPMTVDTITQETEVLDTAVRIPAGNSMTIELENRFEKTSPIRVKYTLMRSGDIIAPRNSFVVRHRGSIKDADWKMTLEI